MRLLHNIWLGILVLTLGLAGLIVYVVGTIWCWIFDSLELAVHTYKELGKE